MAFASDYFGGGKLVTQTIETSQNFIVPNNVTKIWVTLQAGGGGGGGSESPNPSYNNAAQPGGGGGAGECVLDVPLIVTSGQVIYVVIGHGGAGGNNPGPGDYYVRNGAAGGDSYFGEYIKVYGGHGGHGGDYRHLGSVGFDAQSDGGNGGGHGDTGGKGGTWKESTKTHTSGDVSNFHGESTSMFGLMIPGAGGGHGGFYWTYGDNDLYSDLDTKYIVGNGGITAYSRFSASGGAFSSDEPWDYLDAYPGGGGGSSLFGAGGDGGDGEEANTAADARPGGNATGYGAGGGGSGGVPGVNTSSDPKGVGAAGGNGSSGVCFVSWFE